MWTVRNRWKKVIFSDETKIEVRNNREVYVWRKVDERLRPECNGLYQGRNYKTKFSVMFWGCISYYGVVVVGNLNSEKYINILDDNLWPVIAQQFPTYSRRTMPHAMCLGLGTIQWKTENDIPTLEWPPQSPDLNIIENVWKVIKTKVQRRIDDIRNAEDLKTVVAEIWTSLQLHYIRSVYDSLPRRLRVVLRARGNITK